RQAQGCASDGRGRHAGAAAQRRDRGRAARLPRALPGRGPSRGDRGTAARDAMRALERFKPYLTGSVLTGLAGPYAEIDLQLFPDSTKEVEIFLLDRNLTFSTQEGRRYAGDRARA